MFEREHKFDVRFYTVIAAFYLLMTVAYSASGRWGWAAVWLVAAGMFAWLAREYHRRNAEIRRSREELTAELDKFFGDALR